MMTDRLSINRTLARFLRCLGLAAVAALAVALAVACRSPAKKAAETKSEGIILGFSQIGSESAWRLCNTRSVQEAAAANGIQLVFSNAEQKQENQIKAIRSFIAYQVDVIAFVPIVADGWDNVLQEAKVAGIPVLVTDRKINTADESLYAGYIGTDSVQEGREAALFLVRKYAGKHIKKDGVIEPVTILELSGTEGSSPALGRAQGFREVMNVHPEFRIVYSESGDFLRSKGNEIMRSVLSQHLSFDVLFSHNDAMTLGALDAMREQGIKTGTGIVVVTIDAEQAAIDALRAGQINCVIECNPKTGPAIMDLAEKLAAGKKIPRRLHVAEMVFKEGQDLSAVEPRGY